MDSSEAVAAAASGAELRILTIDDSQTTRRLICDALTSDGYDVDTASDGITAISKIKNQRYDLLTLDVEMPGLHGIEVLRIVRKIDPEIVVIMVTNLDSIQTALHCIRQGAYDYVTKPFTSEEMVLAVGRGIEQRRLSRENKRLVENLRKMNEELEEKVRLRTRSLEESAQQLQVYAHELEHKNTQLEEAYRKLKELDRLKSEFITIASHELRTPLVAIQGYNSILLGGRMGSLSDSQRRGLQISGENIQRLTNIVQDILDISRIDSTCLDLRPKVFDLGELVAQLRDEAAPLAERRKQTISVACRGPVPPVYADRNRIIQVFYNLILNAIRFTPDGGSITLGVTEPVPNAATHVEMWVSDTGIGIEEKYYEQVFERFFEIQPSEHHSSGTIEFRSGGSGLGLSIVKGIVEQHGGKVWVSSELTRGGIGSTFTFTLPRGDLTPLPQLEGEVRRDKPVLIG
ncbi:MAG: response regulator [Candidatus Schekmanbacteria bacterium]|nr:response regulator [Candidatus Schekmanbacteria bacterium]